MKSDIEEGIIPSDFIDGIEKSIDDVKLVRKKKVKVKRSTSNWPKIKENIDDLKIKCADFSKKSNEADSIEEKNELALQAKEIREKWLEIRAMMDGEK